MGYQSEAQLEKNLLTQLTKISYSTVTIPDYEDNCFKLNEDHILVS